MTTFISNSIIRDNIEGNRLIDVPEGVRSIIDSAEFQRLRNIRQMGLSYLIFPTSEHSRFSHSLGVYATSQQMFEELARRSRHFQFHQPWFRFDDYAKTDFTIAALCHDIGHTAFSHVLEGTLLPEGFRSHEECTRALISESNELSRKIDDVADREAILSYFDKNHPNKALNDLISSAFDVDRCDYILRDSHMSGVEYGKYDLKWLIHSMKVARADYLGNPVLLLDGPRGIDALRQFLSARRYLHKQVYYHASVRGAQLLLKGIFECIQDIGDDIDSRNLIPPCLHCLIERRRPTIGEFLETTDVEVQYMIRRLAAEHRNQTLKYICSLFSYRKLPKCILDTSKNNNPLYKKYRIRLDEEEVIQGNLWEDLDEVGIRSLCSELGDFIEERMEAQGYPAAAAKYLVAFDTVRFSSTPPTDMLFAFKDGIFTLDRIAQKTIGFDILGLLESFTIERLFVPVDLGSEALGWLEQRFANTRQNAL